MTWEERWHPLRQEWVVVAAHRQRRPWIGHTVQATVQDVPTYDPKCYLCPGNRRISGAQNERYQDVFVFDNDHPCVGSSAPPAEKKESALFLSRAAKGHAKVLCYRPRHDLSLAELELDEVTKLLRAWQLQTQELAALPEIEHVLIFENRGEVVGVSNPHPHCQIYATNFVCKTTAVEVQAAREHFQQTGRSLLANLIVAERAEGRRIIDENEHAIAFVPYFARFAYETYIAPKRAHQNLSTLSPAEVADMAGILRRMVTRYDNLWAMPFPYIMAVHQAPTDGAYYEGFHAHLEFHPPLRAPSLLKHLAGPEVGAGTFISDVSPEQKADELLAVSPTQHYKQVHS